MGFPPCQRKSPQCTDNLRFRPRFETLESRAMLSAASLTDWVGIGNTTSPNNYVVTSTTSAGGTFAERRLTAASLSDQTLAGGTFDWNNPLSMSGTVQFTSGYDPVFFFGWYDSTNLNERIGLGAANPVPAGAGTRWQTQSGNTAATGVVSQDLNTSTTNSTFAPGTYNFTFSYDGAGHMTGTLGTLNWARNYAAPTNQDLNMNRFGFLQKSTADDDVHTFVVNVSNINYTGETQVSAPRCPATTTTMAESTPAITSRGARIMAPAPSCPAIPRRASSTRPTSFSGGELRQHHRSHHPFQLGGHACCRPSESDLAG